MRRVLGLPYFILQGVYHAIVPYKRRIICWSWRRRNTFYLRLLGESLQWKIVRSCQSELKQILAQYPGANGVVIFPPSVPWYTELFQRPQQMALAFASLGYVTLYWVEDIDSHDESIRFRKVAERLHLCKVPPVAFWVCQHPIFISYTYNYNWAAFLRSPMIVYELIDHLD